MLYAIYTVHRMRPETLWQSSQTNTSGPPFPISPQVQHRRGRDRFLCHLLTRAAYQQDARYRQDAPTGDRALASILCSTGDIRFRLRSGKVLFGLLGPDILKDTWIMALILWTVNLCRGVKVLINMIIKRILSSLHVCMASWASLAVHIYWLRIPCRSILSAKCFALLVFLYHLAA